MKSKPPQTKVAKDSAALRWVLACLPAITPLIGSVGRLGDLVGRRRLLLAGMLLLSLSSALCGMAPTLGLLIAARAAQGLGAAVMMVLTMPFVAGAAPKSSTGSALGLLGTMSAVGTALGPTLGGVLIASFGWPALSFLNLPLGALAFVLAHRHLPADRQVPRLDGAGFDPAGTLRLAMTLAAYALAMTMRRGRFGTVNWPCQWWPWPASGCSCGPRQEPGHPWPPWPCPAAGRWLRALP